jgi:hypothetical protein
MISRQALKVNARYVHQSFPGPRQSLSIFQSCPHVKPPSLGDVHDALVVCKTLKEKDAIDYCISIGIDYSNAVRYYGTIDYLYRSWRAKQPKSNTLGNK